MDSWDAERSGNVQNNLEQQGGITETTTARNLELGSSTMKRKAPERALHRDAALRALPGLSLHVFEITEDGKLAEYDGNPYEGLSDALVSIKADSADEKQEALSKDAPSYWVHIDADERDRVELNEWIDRLSLGSFISEQIKKPAEEWLSHVVSTRSKALIMIRILPLMDEDGDFVFNQVEYLAAVKTKHMLLTYTTTQSGGRFNLAKETLRYMTQEEVLQAGSSDAALIAWLEFHIRRTQRAITNIRMESLNLVRRMDQEPSSVQLDEIMGIRDNLLVALAVAEEQSQCLDMMKGMDKDTDGVDFSRLKGALSLLIGTASSTERMGSRLEKRAKGLKNTFDSTQQDRMNRRLAILTVVSVIFMPLTFLAGVYGMNFAIMPELEYDNSYYIVLISMLAIAVGMLLFFHYHGWFV